MIHIGNKRKIKINFKHFNNTSNLDAPVITMCSLQLLGVRNKNLRTCTQITGHKNNRLNRK